MYLIFLSQQVRASSVAGLCYADSSLAWLVGLQQLQVNLKSEPLIWVWWNGQCKNSPKSETSTSIPTWKDFPHPKWPFPKLFRSSSISPGTMPPEHPSRVTAAFGAQPPAPKSIRFTTWKLQHHLYRSLHMLRFFIVILALAHICMSHKNPILLINFLHGNEGRKLRRLSRAPFSSNWSCEAFDVSCLNPIISTSRNVLLACMCEVLWSFPNTRKCISCSNTKAGYRLRNFEVSSVVSRF